MKKYDLLQSGESIIRVLEIEPERVLVIDCVKRTMPVWVESASVERYEDCGVDELYRRTGRIPVKANDLDMSQQKVTIRKTRP